MPTSLIDLPEEVLLQVARCLHGDRASLAALMQTHGVLFRIATPFLYAGPFRLLQDEPNFHWVKTEETRRYDRLAHLLLVSSGLLKHREIDRGGFRFPEDNGALEQQHQQQGATDRALMGLFQSQATIVTTRHTNGQLPSYGPEVIPLDLPTTTNYLAYYTDMHHDPMLHETFMTLFPFIPHCYRAHPVAFPALIHTRNQIELAMIDRLAPQLQSLTISLHFNVPRIKVPWLSHLRRLEILGTEFGLLTSTDLALGKYRITNRATRSVELQSGTWTRLDQLLVFVVDHNRIHGTLRELKIDNNLEGVYLQPSERLVEIVEAMGDQLEVLDVECWPDAVWYLDRIPTANLRKLTLHRSKTPVQNWDQARFCRFLESCTHLEDLQTFTAQADIFSAWQPPSPPSIRALSAALSPTEQKPQPIALKNYIRTTSLRKRRRGMRRIEIMGYAEVVNTAVNEATVLFADTLESITVRSWFSGKLTSIPLSWTTTGTMAPAIVVAGQQLSYSNLHEQPPRAPRAPSSLSPTANWLPQLTELDLQGEIAWTFDFESLLSCPRLVRLRLAFSGPVPRRSVAKQAPAEILRQLWTLRDVELEGSWETLSKKGWIGTLSQVRNLERLVLSECLGAQGSDMMQLVQTILAEARARCARDWSELDTVDRCHAFAVHPGYCERLRYVHMSKRIEDAFKRLWVPYLKTVDRTCTRPSALPDLAHDLIHSHIHRVQFSYLPQAPSAH
ncbi:hypothetical protein DFQ27_008393 [Actinomortierella ambigua]|uniref:Uncharacterized protein n=1 Tax=Actinomortierella ambigua TaxID=1343610 RepID=A0A9P6QJ30_9FUNG|nr:hypothetical protein DFQ27_008393 [Actinomortierella ambigua]